MSFTISCLIEEGNNMGTLLSNLNNIGFLSWQFYFMLLLYVPLFWIIPPKCRKFMLILASLVFYVINGMQTVILLFYLILSSWIMAVVIEKTKTKNKKWLLWAGIIVVVIPFLRSRLLNSGGGQILSSLGLAYTTLMAAGYLVDVYKKRYTGISFIDYAAFVSFFPYAVSGPIERADHISIQMRKLENKSFSWKQMQSGAILVIYGLFVKLVIADRIGILVDTVLDHYKYYVGFEVLLAVILYGAEIYCDFLSCSNIARGIARCLGIEIVNNFKQPYFACSISEFWRRWHISLSVWLRDYVYIPLGGNRKGKIRHYANLFITFVVSGLWHGFSWHFVVWGAIHGTYQIIGKLTQPIRCGLNRVCHIDTKTIGHRLIQVILTFCMVDFAWLFFRFENISDVFDVVKRIVRGLDFSFLNNGGYLHLGLDLKDWHVLLLGMLILFAVDLLHYLYKERFILLFLNENLGIRYLVFLLLFAAIVVFGIYGAGYNATSFIYRGF